MIAYYLLASRVRMSPGCVNHKTLPLVAMPPGLVQGMGTPPKTKSKRFFIME